MVNFYHTQMQKIISESIFARYLFLFFWAVALKIGFFWGAKPEKGRLRQIACRKKASC